MYYGVDSDEDAAKVGDEFADSYAELEPVFGGKEYIQDYIDHTEDGDLITANLYLLKRGRSRSSGERYLRLRTMQARLLQYLDAIMTRHRLQQNYRRQLSGRYRLEAFVCFWQY